MLAPSASYPTTSLHVTIVCRLVPFMGVFLESPFSVFVSSGDRRCFMPPIHCKMVSGGKRLRATVEVWGEGGATSLCGNVRGGEGLDAIVVV